MAKDQNVIEVQPALNDELMPSEQPPAQHLELDDLGRIRLRVSASIGHAVMRVREILDLKEGSIIALDKLAGELTDIYINELALARGEVVVIGDVLHVRLSEVLGVSERMERDNE